MVLNKNQFQCRNLHNRRSFARAVKGWHSSCHSCGCVGSNPTATSIFHSFRCIRPSTPVLRRPLCVSKNGYRGSLARCRGGRHTRVCSAILEVKHGLALRKTGHFSDCTIHFTTEIGGCSTVGYATPPFLCQRVWFWMCSQNGQPANSHSVPGRFSGGDAKFKAINAAYRQIQEQQKNPHQQSTDTNSGMHPVGFLLLASSNLPRTSRASSLHLKRAFWRGGGVEKMLEAHTKNSSKTFG